MQHGKIIKREFVNSPRYGYGAIDELVTYEDGYRSCLRNVFSGKWLTQKAADWIAQELNRVYWDGHKDSEHDTFVREHQVCMDSN